MLLQLFTFCSIVVHITSCACVGNQRAAAAVAAALAGDACTADASSVGAYQDLLGDTQN
jgi:hypothetical protein